MIELRTGEKVIPLTHVPKLSWMPHPDGRKLHIATIYRWCSRGLRGHRLEFMQLGGMRVTTEAALLRFFEALAQSESNPTIPARRQRTIEQVRLQLDAAGF